jgi:hypothetical protein
MRDPATVVLLEVAHKEASVGVRSSGFGSVV